MRSNITELIVRWTGGFLLGTVLASSSASAADVDWRARFLAEAPRAWEKYRDAHRFLQGTCRGARQDQDGSNEKYEIEIKVNESCRLIRAVEPQSTDVFGKNPRYVFHLRIGKDGKWVLLNLFQSDELHAERAKWIEERIARYGRGTVDAIGRVGLEYEWVGDLLNADRIRITRATPKPVGGSTFVEVQFESIVPPGNPGLLEGGILLLDPDRNWLIVNHTASTRSNTATGTQSLRFEFGMGSSPHQLRCDFRQEFKLADRPNPRWTTAQEEYDFRIPDRLPDTREFTVSHYGLPEPVGVKWEKPTPRYVWFLLATGAFAGVAVLFTYLARRARARRAPVA